MRTRGTDDAKRMKGRQRVDRALDKSRDVVQASKCGDGEVLVGVASILIFVEAGQS